MDDQLIPSTDQAAAVALLPEWPTAEDLEAFGQRLLSLELKGGEGLVDISTMHHLVDRLYGRSVVIKAGTFACGATHKIEGFAISVGDITSWTAGAGRQRFTGTHLIATKPGMRLVFAHVDTTWFTVHPNDTGSNDTHVIEASIVERPERLLSRRAPVRISSEGEL